MHLVFTVVLSLCLPLHAQTNKPKRDLSRPWYKRFVGNVGNEIGIIHIQKSYKNATIYIYTPTQKIQFLDHNIIFFKDKIEAVFIDHQTEVEQIIKVVIKNDSLRGFLLSRYANIRIEAKEDYSKATRVKLYEYSYVERGEYPMVVGTANYFYHYSLYAVPEFLVQEFNRKMGDNFLKKCADGLKGEIEELKNNNTSHLTEQSYETVIYNQNNILVIAYGHSSYEGGAHGMYGSSYKHYDLEREKTIELNDIFTGNYKPVLEAMLTKKAKEDGIPVYIDKVYLSDNFYIHPQGISFIYQPYEIAPYAAGVIEITLSYSDIQKILNPNGPHNRIIKK